MAKQPKDHWPIIEARVRHMCQVAHENGPVAAREKIDALMPLLQEAFTAALEDERAEAFKRYEF